MLDPSMLALYGADAGAVEQRDAVRRDQLFQYVTSAYRPGRPAPLLSSMQYR
jgi:hypothetical protein